MCNNCICKAVCSKFAATGGHARECEHFKEERRGQWRYGPNQYKQHGVWCTRCGKGWAYKVGNYNKLMSLVEEHKFCPNCGADMRGAEDG